MSGWIRLHRKMLESLVFDNPELLKVWVWCLLKATHKEHVKMIGFQEQLLEKGQFVFGRKRAAAELDLDESKVYRLIKRLEKMGNISIKSNNKYSVISVENWELYQGGDIDIEQQMNNKRTTTEQQVNTNKNVNNVKNEKNKEYIDVFNFYLSLNLVKHRAYTNDMAKAITKAVKDNKYDIEYCKTLLKRHERVVKISKSTEYPVRTRGFAEFFGQKVFNATHLICSEYEEGGKYYEQYIKNDKPKNTTKPPLKLIIRDNY